MKKEIILTRDGSTTIHITNLNETYHSKHGAIQEAMHVFIKNGLHTINQQNISILEIGFGTGLNALITLLEAQKTKKNIHYTAIEAYPLEIDAIKNMNYPQQLNTNPENFYHLHDLSWQQTHPITQHFQLHKRKHFFQEINDQNTYNLIYFDAFGYDVQPELWSDEIFTKMYNALQPNGILVTYACRSTIIKSMKNAGFNPQKLPGAPGKREMLRATK